MLRLLLAAGARANQASLNGDTPLLFAASRGHLGAVALLAKVLQPAGITLCCSIFGAVIKHGPPSSPCNTWHAGGCRCRRAQC